LLVSAVKKVCTWRGKRAMEEPPRRLWEMFRASWGGHRVLLSWLATETPAEKQALTWPTHPGSQHGRNEEQTPG
jgi:hypothetical protein